MKYVVSKYLTIGYMKVVLVWLFTFLNEYYVITYPCVDYFLFFFVTT